eukprot:3288555-Amphidinium_carterae.1
MHLLASTITSFKGKSSARLGSHGIRLATKIVMLCENPEYANRQLDCFQKACLTLSCHYRTMPEPSYRKRHYFDLRLPMYLTVETDLRLELGREQVRTAAHPSNSVLVCRKLSI